MSCLVPGFGQEPPEKPLGSAESLDESGAAAAQDSFCAKRHRFSSSQMLLLDNVFSVTPLPPKTVIKELAVRLSVEVRNVRVWFRNRRQRFRASYVAIGAAPPELCNGPTRLTSLEKLCPDLPPHEPPAPDPTSWLHPHAMATMAWYGHPYAPGAPSLHASHAYLPHAVPYAGHPVPHPGIPLYNPELFRDYAAVAPAPFPPPSAYMHAARAGPPASSPSAHARAPSATTKRAFVPYSALHQSCRELTSADGTFPSEPGPPASAPPPFHQFSPLGAPQASPAAQPIHPSPGDEEGQRKRPRQWQLQQVADGERTVMERSPAAPASRPPQPAGLLRPAWFLGMQGGRAAFRIESEGAPVGVGSVPHPSSGLLWN